MSKTQKTGGLRSYLRRRKTKKRTTKTQKNASMPLKESSTYNKLVGHAKKPNISSRLSNYNRLLKRVSRKSTSRRSGSYAEINSLDDNVVNNPNMIKKLSNIPKNNVPTRVYEYEQKLKMYFPPLRNSPLRNSKNK